MQAKTNRLMGALLSAVTAFALVQSPTVKAVPSYARQTGLACAVCHTVYPALTTFGRLFKLNGYTLTNLKQVVQMPNQTAPAMSINQAFPLSVMLQASSNVVDKPLAGQQNPDVNFPQQLSLFLAGEITPHLGTFMQMTYEQASGSIGMDLADIRYANQAQLGSTDVTWGITLNNGPSIEDLWNSTPAWGFPFFGSGTAPGPAAGPFMASDAIQTNSVGIGPYAMFGQHLYATVSVYRTANQGSDPPGQKNAALQGVDPYWRVAWNQDSGDHAWEIGTFGFDAEYEPDGAGPVSDKYTDIGADAQFQMYRGPHIFELRGNYIHESRTFDATAVDHRNNDVSFLNINGDWYYERMIGLSVGYFRTWGRSDCQLYNPDGGGGCAAPDAETGSRTGSPNTDGEVLEVDYLPWANTKLMAQYTLYNEFNGSSSNYDGAGRDASDNNTFLMHLMLAF